MPEENLPEEPAAEEPQENTESEHPSDQPPEASAEVTEETGDEGDKDAIDRELEIFQDLQRLQADFVNYRARVERDRGVERQLAVAEVSRRTLLTTRPGSREIEA